MSSDIWSKVSPNYNYSKKPADIATIDSFINTKPPLLTYDKLIFNQYVEMVRSRYLGRKVEYAHTALVHAKKLLTDIKKQYHLE